MGGKGNISISPLNKNSFSAFPVWKVWIIISVSFRTGHVWKKNVKCRRYLQLQTLINWYHIVKHVSFLLSFSLPSFFILLSPPNFHSFLFFCCRSFPPFVFPSVLPSFVQFFILSFLSCVPYQFFPCVLRLLSLCCHRYHLNLPCDISSAFLQVSHLLPVEISTVHSHSELWKDVTAKWFG